MKKYNSIFQYLLLSSILIFSLIIFSCGEEELISPTTINLSNNTVYEKLPQNTNVGILSTDLIDNSIKFKLISGEGDSNNNEFQIKGTILQNKKVLQFTDEGSRSIRIQASDGMVSYEQAITISVIAFEGTYPSVISNSFNHNELMPREFGNDNGNISPDLDINDIPSNTVSMALIMTDLDDGGSIHWTTWNIPPDKNKIFRRESWTNGVVVGSNNFETIGYTGPFPPSVHRYKFVIYFLTENLELLPNKFSTLTLGMTGKLIAQTSIIGKYKP